MLAVKHCKADLVELLLRNGAVVNLQDSDGLTALMYAVENGSLNIVKLLLTQPECDVDIVDNVRNRIIQNLFIKRNLFILEWSNSD
jgi:ankyrin repeat protein